MSDLIDRDALKKAIGKVYACDWDDIEKNFHFAEAVNSLPSAEPERKNGKWIIRYFDMETYEYKEKVYNYYEKMPEGDVYCSECKESALLNGHEESVFSKFCPHFGAEMIGE